LKQRVFYIISSLFLLLLLPGVTAHATEETHNASNKQEFDAKNFIIEHVKDSHEWHLVTLKNGRKISIPLPVILYSKNSGLHIFLSNKLAYGQVYKGFKIEEEGKYEGKVVEISEGSNEEITGIPLDFSITKTVAGMFIVAIVLLWLFIAVSRSYQKKGINAPHGLQGFLEPVVLFVRDDIAILTIGKEKYERYMPYLLTAFFFIWLNNILGLVPFFPFGANVTGNISVTLVLAVFTFILTQVSGSKQYWKHIVATPGVPIWLAPVMIPVEIISLFTKPFALMIRLFANISAGHMSILTFVGLIFIFKSLLISPVSILFVLFMFLIELLVGLLQAYIFTILSALFIGLAVQEEH